MVRILNKKEETKVDVLSQTYNWLSHVDVPHKNNSDKIKKANLICDLLKEEVQEYIDAVANNDTEEELNACADLLVVAANLAFYSGFSLKDIWLELDQVYISNMTKFCKTLEEAGESKRAYSDGTHPNKKGEKIRVNIFKTNKEEYPYCLKRLDGKIMKSINFKDVEEF